MLHGRQVLEVWLKLNKKECKQNMVQNDTEESGFSRIDCNLSRIWIMDLDNTLVEVMSFMQF